VNKLSLCMIVKNEELKLSRCLDSVQEIVDEIIIVDTGSTDNTIEIASKYDAKIFKFKWTRNLDEARNYSLSKSSGDWNLVLDADEYIDRSSANEIRKFITENHAIGRICRLDEFYIDNQIRYSKVYLSRLFPSGIYYVGNIHEQVISDLPRINTNIQVMHDGYVQENKTKRNLLILLKELEDYPEDLYLNYQVAKQYYLKKEYNKANIFFVKAYIHSNKKEYFFPMLVVDYLYNCRFLKKFKEGLKIIQQEKQNLDFYTDFHFISGLFFMDIVFYDVNIYQSYFSLIEQEFICCLEIGEMYDYDSVQGTGSYLAFYNLGVYNEVIGNLDAALFLYNEAAKLGYQKAKERIYILKN
jgi:glycosyltransferase involved in cell wall biosynthesis